MVNTSNGTLSPDGTKWVVPNGAKIHGFFSWAGNGNVSFADSAWLTYLFYGLIFLTLIICLIFKENIRKTFSKRPWFIRLIGMLTLMFFTLNRILLIMGNYPLKWEIFPFQLCRFAVFLIAIMMLFHKHKYIKYLIFWAVAGAIVGILYFRLHYLASGATHVFNGKTLKVYYDTNVGYDSYFWWDFLLMHSFAIIMPVLLWITLKIKMSYHDFLKSIGFLLLIATTAFVVDWVFKDIHVDFLYLSPTPSFALPIGVLAEWPYIFFTYIVLCFTCLNMMYFIWVLEGWFDVKKFKLNKLNKNYEYFKSTLKIPKKTSKKT